jgi:hypothetical protein
VFDLGGKEVGERVVDTRGRETEKQRDTKRKSQRVIEREKERKRSREK